MSSLASHAQSSTAAATPAAVRVAASSTAALSVAFLGVMAMALPFYVGAAAEPLDIGSLAWLLAAGIGVPITLVAGSRALADRRGAGTMAAVAAERPREAVRADAPAPAVSVQAGLLDAAGFDAELARQVELAYEMEQPLSLAVLDVDQLAQINREHGEEAGDRLLAAISRLLTSRTRTEDAAFRMDGDEFAILMPGCPAGKAQGVLRRLLLAALEEGDRAGAAGEWSFSAGISSLPELSESPAALRRDARAALGWAKAHGRTDVQLFDSFRDLTEEERRDAAALSTAPPLGDDDFTSGGEAGPPIQLRFLGAAAEASPPTAPTVGREAEWVDPRLVLIGLADAPSAGTARRRTDR